VECLQWFLKLLIEQKNPNLKIFLDVDDLEDIHDLKLNVYNSENFAILLTEGVFERRFVVEELTTALAAKKNIILIWDKERTPWPAAESIPEHIREVLLIRAIIWNAEKDFRNVAITQILSKIKNTELSVTSVEPSPITKQPVSREISFFWLYLIINKK